MDVGDDRERAQVDELAERVGVLELRHGDADDLAAGGGEAPDLLHRRVDVVRVRERHRLHDHRRAAAHRDAPDLDPRLAWHRPESIGRDRWIPARALTRAVPQGRGPGPVPGT